MRELGQILVIGGAGFIGRHLVRKLVSNGEKVRVLDPVAKEDDFPDGVEIIAGSMLEPDILRPTMNGVDTLFHLASYPFLWAPKKKIFKEINLYGAELVLTVARQKSVGKAILTSTEAVLRGFRNKGPEPIRESDARPLFDIPGPYTDSKLLQEGIARLVGQEGLDVSVVYPTIPIGAGDRNMTPPTAMMAAFLSGRAPAILENEFNFVDVEDVAEGHILAAKKGARDEGYILGGDNLLLSRFIEILGDVAGTPMPTRRVSYLVANLGARGAEMLSRVTRKPPIATREGVRMARHSKAVDITKARNQLGYAPRPIGPAVKKAVDWLRKEGLV